MIELAVHQVIDKQVKIEKPHYGMIGVQVHDYDSGGIFVGNGDGGPERNV